MSTRQELMKKLKQKGISFSFNALQPELEELLANAKKTARKAKTPRPPTKTIITKLPPDPPEKTKKTKKKKRKYTQTKTASDPGIKCPHCGFTDRKHGGVSHTYQNGNRRMICGKCEKPFMVFPKYK